MEWFNTPRTQVRLGRYEVLSPGWVDPAGKLVTATRDLRKFQSVTFPSRFTVISGPLFSRSGLAGLAGEVSLTRLELD